MLILESIWEMLVSPQPLVDEQSSSRGSSTFRSSGVGVIDGP